jgi:hypothetical protein
VVGGDPHQGEHADWVSDVTGFVHDVGNGVAGGQFLLQEQLVLLGARAGRVKQVGPQVGSLLEILEQFLGVLGRIQRLDQDVSAYEGFLFGEFGIGASDFPPEDYFLLLHNTSSII